MAGVVSDSRVCGEQQSSYSNKGFTFHSKLWKKVKDGGRYQKEGKSRESNRAYKEDEESTRESRSSID